MEVGIMPAILLSQVLSRRFLEHPSQREVGLQCECELAIITLLPPLQALILFV